MVKDVTRSLRIVFEYRYCTTENGNSLVENDSGKEGYLKINLLKKKLNLATILPTAFLISGIKRLIPLIMVVKW